MDLHVVTLGQSERHSSRGGAGTNDQGAHADPFVTGTPQSQATTRARYALRVDAMQLAIHGDENQTEPASMAQRDFLLTA